LVILGAPHAPALPTLEDIEAASSPRSCLALVSRWRPMLPWPVQCFALALVVVLLVPRVWPLLQNGHDSASGVPPGDAMLAWQGAIAKSAGHRIVHGVQGTRSLLEIFHGLPVSIGGWGLLQAECAASPDRWRCRAEYRRKHGAANSISLLTRAPAG